MSWHGRWRPGALDPFAKPAKVGDHFGIFEVVDTKTAPHPHYGIQAKVRCIHCGQERVAVVAKLRHKAPQAHRGCRSVA